jgi:hypothetical protein
MALQRNGIIKNKVKAKKERPRRNEMKPAIHDTGFGYISVQGSKIEHDIVIRLSGKIKKRRKKLSKAVYGTSHIVSLEEAKQVYQDGAERLIIGSGQEGMVRLSEEAVKFFKKKKCKVNLQPTPKAIKYWDKAKGAVIGLFHVTC